MAEEIRQLMLSDGRIAQIRRPKGRDLIRAHDVAGENANRFKFTCGLLAQITTLGGKPCVMEDIQDLYADDIDKLAEEAGKGFLSSTAAPSPSSSNGDSPTPS